MPSTIWSGVRTPALAVVTLLALQPALFAQLSKVDCKDKECVPWWQQVCLFYSQHKPCCTAGSKHCSPFKQETYGYHPPQWRTWPGVQPNYSPVPKALRALKEFGLDSDLPSPTPVKKPGKQSQNESPGVPPGINTAQQSLPLPTEFLPPSGPVILNGPAGEAGNQPARLAPPMEFPLPPPPAGGKF
jgi:hypothetical protein